MFVYYNNYYVQSILHTSLDPAPQPNTVETSGFRIMNVDIIFTPSSMFEFLPPFVINDDIIALEDIEQYNASFVSSVPSEDVVLGAPATISIIDDEGKYK